MKHITIAGFILFLLIASNTLSDEKTFNVLKKKFSSTKTFTADFSEQTITKKGSTQSFSGKISLKRPHFLRMEILSPQKELIIYNGKKVWFYFPEKQYCLIYSSSTNSYISKVPEYIFSPFDNLTADTIITTGDSIIVELNPVDTNTTIKSLHFVCMYKTMFPKSITLTDRTGNKTVYSFSNVKINIKKEIDFNFSPPQGTKIIEK
ncbi:MAG: outer membrane lipoprotein carrier protein LolA [Candidatus Cloacimonas sp. 4484_209]|nr:MAG: outer membrane lipoprotein carrier protein LolA [Candidatus Cloacimonas sp. 4484_209]